MQALKCFMKLRNNHIFVFFYLVPIFGNFKLYMKTIYIMSNINYKIIIYYEKFRTTGRRRAGGSRLAGTTTLFMYTTITIFKILRNIIIEEAASKWHDPPSHPRDPAPPSANTIDTVRAPDNAALLRTASAHTRDQQHYALLVINIVTTIAK